MNENEESFISNAYYESDNQFPERSKIDPSSYFIKESNYEISPSIVEEDESTVFEVYPETLEDSEFLRRSYQSLGKNVSSLCFFVFIPI